MAIRMILCTCDWCEHEAKFEEDGEDLEAGWVFLMTAFGERAYCSIECLVKDFEHVA